MAEVGDLIIVGTYEEFVLGYRLVEGSGDSEKNSLVQTFATQTHGASVRSLAVSGRYLASGGADETIQLYDLVAQVTCGSLTHHNGTVNTLAFSSDESFLLSGGDDGLIAVVQTGSWFVEKIWKCTHHGKAVIGLSIHPSGKLALSIGSDNRIITWDLVKGRRAFVMNVTSRCRNGWGLGGVQWSPDGTNYAVFMSTHVEVYSISTATVSHVITCSNRVTSMCFLLDSVLLVGEETGEASIQKLKFSSSKCKENESDELIRFQSHDRRVKCVGNIGSVKNGSCKTLQFTTVSSTGVIRLWEWADDQVIKVCEVQSECRVTSLEFVKVRDIDHTKEQQSVMSNKSLQYVSTEETQSTKTNGIQNCSQKSLKENRRLKRDDVGAKVAALEKNSLKWRKTRYHQDRSRNNFESKWVVSEIEVPHFKNSRKNSVFVKNAGKWTVTS